MSVGPNERRDDEELVALARAGSEAACGEVLSRLYPVVLAYVDRRMGGHLRRFTTAEDVTQAVCARALPAFCKLRAGALMDDVQGLLLQHARWALLDHAQDLREARPESSAPREATAAPDGSSTGSVTRADEALWVEGILDRFDQDTVAIVRQRLDGQTFPQISLTLGMREDAVRKRFHRAIDEVKRLTSRR